MQRPAKPLTPVRFRIQPPNIMKIAIIGFGFVGKALFNGLIEGIEILKIDPKLNTSIDNLSKFNPEVIFICLPTPMNNDGSQDISIVKETLEEITRFDIKCLIELRTDFSRF